ncbi:MAG: Hint domain-containing protein [Pseudomonadota bacterium]
MGTCAGAQVISHIQTRVDGAFPSTRNPFPFGSTFRWHGEPLRLDGVRRSNLLAQMSGLQDTQIEASIVKLNGQRPRRRVAPAAPIDDPEALILASGGRRWVAQLIPTDTAELLLLFPDGLPPVDDGLTIVQSARPRQSAPPRNTICFTEGTLVDTQRGPVAVEDIFAGDRVMTRDDGAQEVLWTGLRRLSGHQLSASPGLRPVRIRADALRPGSPDPDLLVSPSHQLLVAGPKARALWGEPEVLIRARDLVDDRRILVDHRLTEVTYVHLLFRRHQIVRANGLLCESFHPGDADLTPLPTAEREELLEIAPDVDRDVHAYGPHARRCLSSAEVAILRHEGIPRHLA